MENVTDALKMAFALFVFVISLTIAITTFTQVNEISEIVLTSSDITRFYTYDVADEDKQTRIVGLETVIPTLYKYYKENYTVLFLDSSGEPLSLYKSQTDIDNWGSGSDGNGKNEDAGIIGKYYKNGSDENLVCSFDVDEETIRHEPWTGNKTDFKLNLDAFLYGGIFKYPSGNNEEYNYDDGFIDKYSDKLFKEMIGEYYYSVDSQEGSNDENLDLQKNRKKRVIIYQIYEEPEKG